MNNPISLANNTRSLLEQIAVFSYVIDSTLNMNNLLRNQCEAERIHSIIDKTQKFIDRVYYGKRSQNEQDNTTKAIHVQEAIKELSSKFKDATELYDHLCEYVHPNYSNNLLVSSGELGKGKIGEINIKETCMLVNCSHSFIDFVCLKFMKQSVIHWKINHFIELCFQKKAKITNVFLRKETKHTGDGKTKETAFFFTEARTSEEHRELTYDLLTEMGHNVANCLARRSNAGLSEDRHYIYDIYKLDNGTFWFKIPLKLDY